MERLLLPITNINGKTEHIDPTKMYRTQSRSGTAEGTIVYFDTGDALAILETEEELADKIIQQMEENMQQRAEHYEDMGEQSE